MPYEIYTRVPGVSEVLAPDSVELTKTKDANIEDHVHKKVEDVGLQV